MTPSQHSDSIAPASGRAEVGQAYEFPTAPRSGRPPTEGNRYLIYDEDRRYGLLIGRNLTDPGAADIYGAPGAWPTAATLINPSPRSVGTSQEDEGT